METPPRGRYPKPATGRSAPPLAWAPLTETVVDSPPEEDGRIVRSPLAGRCASGLRARQHAALELGNGREDRAKLGREDGRDAGGAKQRATGVVEVTVHGQELRPPQIDEKLVAHQGNIRPFAAQVQPLFRSLRAYFRARAYGLEALAGEPRPSSSFGTTSGASR